MNGATTGVSNALLAGAASTGLLYHVVREYGEREEDVGPVLNAREALDSILSMECIRGHANKGAFARPEGVKTVSFSGSSLSDLRRLSSRRRSEFGICFRRESVDPSGREIRPVHYLERGALEMIKERGLYPEGLSRADRPWIDLVEEGVYSFEWEEEWRAVGDFRFGFDSIVCLVVPTSDIGERYFEKGYNYILAEAFERPERWVDIIARQVQDMEIYEELQDPNISWGDEDLDEQVERAAEIEAELAEERAFKRLEGMMMDPDFTGLIPGSRGGFYDDIESGIYTDSGEIEDPDGEENIHEAAMHDLDDQLDEIFEDGE